MWLQRCFLSPLHPVGRKNSMNESRWRCEWRKKWDFKETGWAEVKEASQKCLEYAALVKRRLLSYLTLLCNTWCIPPQACMLALSSFLVTFIISGLLWSHYISVFYHFPTFLDSLLDSFHCLTLLPSFRRFSPTRVGCLFLVLSSRARPPIGCFYGYLNQCQCMIGWVR